MKVQITLKVARNDFPKFTGPGIDDAMKTALTVEAERTMTLAKRKTPVDTGNLRASGHVQPVHGASGNFQADLVFGGPAAPYAIYVHEILTNYHPVGEAKFLENAVMERSGTFAKNMGALIRHFMKGV